LSSKSTNNEISTVVSDQLRLTEEIDNALSEESKTGVPGLGRELVAKARSFQNAFSNSGVSLQKCKSAVLEGRILDHVAGLNGVSTDEVGAWSGFTDAGRTQFLNDIYRPVAPSDTKTKQPLIAEENNVFRFNIDGQNYTANKAKDKNDDIAKAIENFCNKEVHPVQTDAVFFSLAQGGTSQQTNLSAHGYNGGDHGPISYTLTKDADTGSINIKYSNPEGSPLKFSWTATIDVDGKITMTPIQVEKD